MRKTLDVYIVGLGGQGILTIGDLLAQAAVNKGFEANFYPTKGMSQRGGFVQGQLRIGRENAGASLPPGGADLIVAMERSEAFKAVRYCAKGTEFMLYDGVLPTAAAIMGKEDYPQVATVSQEIKQAGAKLFYLDSQKLPEYEGKPVFPNMFILGALLKQTMLADLFSYEEIVAAIKEAWPGRYEANLAAFEAGYQTTIDEL